MGIFQRLKLVSGKEISPVEKPGPGPSEDRRRHRRLQNVKLTVYIGDKRYKTKDWSLGGFRLMAPGSNFVTGQRISGALHGPGLFDRGTYEAAIAWVADDGELGAHFIEISHNSFLAMSAVQV